MNRTLILTATIGLAAMTSACTPAQQRQFLAAVNKSHIVVNHHPTVVTPLPRNEATVTIDISYPVFPAISADAPCGEPGGGNCPQPSNPPTTVYTGPPRMQCDDGSFAPQGDCPPPADQPTATNPEFMQCEDGTQPYGTCQNPNP